MQNGAARIVPQRLLTFVADAGIAATSAAAVYVGSLLSSAQVLGVSVLALFFQPAPETPMPPTSEVAFVRWAIEQGGLVVALVTMFYFFRQAQRENATRILEMTKEHAAELVGLVKDRDAALRDERERNNAYAQLLAANTVALTKLTTAIEDAQNERFPPRAQLPVR